MVNIYEQHAKAFENVAAYIILWENDVVAKIALKYPKDGVGRLYAYVHWLGVRMERGWASGYGYDKGSAAVGSAVSKMGDATASDQDKFMRLLSKDDGYYWYDRLEHAGFRVIQAV
jgi:hypothetical protein